MIPARYAPILFGFLLSWFMSGMVSAISVYRSLDVGEPFLGSWFGAWFSSWLIAFPVVLVVAPITRRLVTKLTK